MIATRPSRSRQQLPSFLFLCDADEAQQKSLEVPGWLSEIGVVGSYARSASAEQPERTRGIGQKLALQSSCRIVSRTFSLGTLVMMFRDFSSECVNCLLKHLIATWSEQFPDAPIGEQQVVLNSACFF